MLVEYSMKSKKSVKSAIFGVFFAIKYGFADMLQNTYPKHIKFFWDKVYDVLSSGKNLRSPSEYSMTQYSPTDHIASGEIQPFGYFCGF